MRLERQNENIRQQAANGDGLNVAALRGGAPPAPYEGAGNCYIEFGGGLVGKVEANFLGGPAPTTELVGPTREFAAQKEEFGSIRRARWFGSAP